MRIWFGVLSVGASFVFVLSAMQMSSTRVSAQQFEPTCPAQSNPIEPISASAGDLFAIGTLSNPTTGYSWQMAMEPDPNVATFVADVYVQPDSRLLGAGGRECWVFSAVQPGSITVTFLYLRPFDPPEIPPANMATFTIVVN
jgi:predicted secreted protein